VLAPCLGDIRSLPADLLPATIRAAVEGRGLRPGFPDGNALTVFTPGLLVMQGILGTTFVGFGLIAQLRGGVIERLRVTPVNRLALLLGNALRDVVILAVQAFLLVLVARLLGLEADPIGVVSVFGLLVMLGLLTASCSYALAILLKDENAFASTLNFFLFPVLLLSGVFLPLTLAPAWIQNAAAINPFSYAVDAARALFNGDFGDAAVVYGFGNIAILSLLALWWAARSFRRATA
jgi:ABC-2 type transport system permease protein